MKTGQNGTLQRPIRPPRPTSTTVLGENKPVVVDSILVFHHGSESEYGSVWNCGRTAGVGGIGDVSSGMNNVLKHRLQHPIRRDLGLVRDLNCGLIVTDRTVYPAK